MPAYPFPLQKLFFSKEEEEKGGGGKSFVRPPLDPFPVRKSKLASRREKRKIGSLQLTPVPLVFAFFDFFKGRLEKKTSAVCLCLRGQQSGAADDKGHDLLFEKFRIFIRETGGRRLRFRKRAHREDNFLNPFQGQTGMKVLDVAEKKYCSKTETFLGSTCPSQALFFSEPKYRRV